MALFLVSGLIGMGLHQNANAEFELRDGPVARRHAAVQESLSGATPALAPGTMIQLGLIGLVYTYRHPPAEAGYRSDEEAGMGRVKIEDRVVAAAPH